MEIVGPITFETADGHPLSTATYTKHYRLRPYQIAFQGVWYVQNRQENGRWIYRALTGPSGSCASDPAVQED